MIIQFLGDKLLQLLNTIINFNLQRTELLDDIYYVVDLAFDWGYGIYKFFIPNYARALILIVVAVKGAVLLYFLVMWILRKIPVASID